MRCLQEQEAEAAAEAAVSQPDAAAAEAEELPLVKTGLSWFPFPSSLSSSRT